MSLKKEAVSNDYLANLRTFRPLHHMRHSVNLDNTGWLEVGMQTIVSRNTLLHVSQPFIISHRSSREAADSLQNKTLTLWFTYRAIKESAMSEWYMVTVTLTYSRNLFALSHRAPHERWCNLSWRCVVHFGNLWGYDYRTLYFEY